MRNATLILAAMIVAPACSAQQQAEARARLTIGEELYRVPIGKPFAVMLGGERMTMRIEIDETKPFSEAGVRFEYPAGFRARRDDSDENVTVWTMEGRSAAIVLQRYRDTLDVESLGEAIAASIVERHGADRVEQEAINLRGEDRAYPGSRLLITASEGGGGSTETEQNLFVFENAEGVFTLVAQDSRPRGAGATDEFKNLVRLLGESFEGGEAPEREPPPADDPAEPSE